jgi:tripartite-type tricarboxylate transporter receptor subunit TctC
MRIIIWLLLLAVPASSAEVRLLIPSEPGGNYDLAGRLIARQLSKHLAGHPTIVPQNMPGAGGLIGANHLYNVAPKDGSVIGLVQARLSRIRRSAILVSVSTPTSSVGSGHQPAKAG